MSFRSLLKHRVSVWRFTQSSVSSGTRSSSRSWDDADRTGLRARIQERPGERQEDTGGGERTRGRYLGFMLADADVQEGDIVQVTAGPGTWGFLKVDGRSVPDGRHTELELNDTREDPTA